MKPTAVDELDFGGTGGRIVKLVKPLLDKALPLTEAAEAHRLVAAGEVKGNIVLLPWAA